MIQSPETGWEKQSSPYATRFSLKFFSFLRCARISSTVKWPEKHKNHKHESYREGERGIYRAGVRNEISLINPTVQSSQAAVGIVKLKIRADFRDERCKGVCQYRVHAEDETRRRPLPPAAQIHGPIAGGQQQAYAKPPVNKTNVLVHKFLLIGKYGWSNRPAISKTTPLRPSPESCAYPCDPNAAIRLQEFR